MSKRLPEIAFVTDISGECKAGATPQTTRYPIKPARPKVKKLLINRGPVAFPSAIAVPIPVETVATSRIAFCHGVIARASFSASVAFVGVGDAVGAGGGARGTGSRGVPLCTTRAPRTTSSSKLIWKLEGVLTGATERRNFVILFE